MGNYTVEEIHCRTALSPSLLPGVEYSLNPYHGCQHGCLYCYVPNVFHIDRCQWGKIVKPKINIPKILAKELKTKQKGVVGISTVTDPYQQLEKSYCLTRHCLEQLLRYDFPINILTKSDLVKRDIEIIKQFSQSAVGMTIPGLNNNEIQLLEPYASSVTSRLNALKSLSLAGIYTYIFFGPIYPTLEVNHLPNLMDTFLTTGVREIIVDVFHLKPGIWSYLKERLPDPEKQKFKERLFDPSYSQTIIAALEKMFQGKIIFRKAFSR